MKDLHQNKLSQIESGKNFSFRNNSPILCDGMMVFKKKAENSHDIRFLLTHSGGLLKVPNVLTKSQIFKLFPPSFGAYALQVLDRAIIVNDLMSLAFSLKICAPLELLSLDYYQYHMSFEFNQFGLERLIIMPISDNIDTSFWFHFFKNSQFDDNLKEQILDILPVPDVGFTPKQSQVFQMIREEKTTEQICQMLNTNKYNLYKYYRRIKQKLDVFFESNFENVHEATHYFNRCFG
jgi:hypothetical protein